MLGKKELLQNLVGSVLDSSPDLLDSINSLSGGFDDADLPLLDREHVDGSGLTDLQRKWRTDGVLILNSFIPEELMVAYRDDWIQHNRINHDRPMGYPGECPYFQVPSLMEICTYSSLHEILKSLIGDDMGVHLNLSGWKSTTRNWHQDGYLNPDSNNDHYLAVWVALNDIHEDSDPLSLCEVRMCFHA